MKLSKRLLTVFVLLTFLICSYSPMARAVTNDTCMECWEGFVWPYCRGGAVGFETELHDYSGGKCRKWLVHAYTDWICDNCGNLYKTTIHACYLYHESCGARRTTYCPF